MMLKPWDGRDVTGKYQYPLEDIKFWDMQIGESGTIYYMTHETPPKLNIWCPASKLTAHLRNLEQLKAKR